MDYKGAVVVFENGHCENLKEAINNRKKNRDGINVDETVKFSKLCILRSKAICVIVSVDSKLNLIYNLYYKNHLYTHIKIF